MKEKLTQIQSEFLKLHAVGHPLCRSEKSPFAAKRLNNVIEFLTFEVFRYTCRGLYETHKFLLVLFLTLKKDLQTGYVKHSEFQVFIKGHRLKPSYTLW